MILMLNLKLRYGSNRPLDQKKARSISVVLVASYTHAILLSKLTSSSHKLFSSELIETMCIHLQNLILRSPCSPYRSVVSPNPSLAEAFISRARGVSLDDRRFKIIVSQLTLQEQPPEQVQPLSQPQPFPHSPENTVSKEWEVR